MKYLKTLTAIIFSIFILVNLSLAKSDIDIKVNGTHIYSEVSPFISGSSTYVPIRFISKALNITDIQWNPVERSVTIKDSATTLVLFADKNYAYINGQYKKIENKVLISESRTFVPVRFISECFDANVNWDEASNTILITSNNKTVTSSNEYDDSVYWLSRIIEAEASGEPFRGKVAVGEVILNRVESKEFPNTIWGVIFDDNFGIQFEPVGNGSIYNTPSSESIEAAKVALNGSNYASECLYFLNPEIAKNTWIPKNREYYTTIANHEFYA